MDTPFQRQDYEQTCKALEKLLEKQSNISEQAINALRRIEVEAKGEKYDTPKQLNKIHSAATSALEKIRKISRQEKCSVCKIVLDDANCTKHTILCDGCENDIMAECQYERQ